jgi:FlaA1/EpsC-like NDP-sugar epimerase
MFRTPSQNTLIAMAHDLVAIVLAWLFAYLLRFNLELPDHFTDEMWRTLVFVIPLQGLVFWYFGLYKGVWRYASIYDLRRIVLATILSAALIPLMFWMLRAHVVIPRSVILLDPLLLILIMSGDRLIYRMWKEKLLTGRTHLKGEPVLIIGAGDTGVSLSKELQRSQTWNPVGYLDDNRTRHNRLLNGIKVFGDIDSLTHWADRLSVTQAIIAMPSATHQQRKRAIDLCTQAGVKVLTVPSFDDLMSGRVAVSQLRAIELDDLLGRDPVALDDAGLHDLLNGKVILVTGAGGSIGSELCRQIARFGPGTLVLFEASEFALYNIEQDLAHAFPELNKVFLAGDVRDQQRVEEVFNHWKPDVVFHAAAYKHVPLMEKHNAWQAVRNNVFGTWCVASTAQRHGAQKFVLISTDKAVNPTNVMGTTKRLAEMVCQGLQQPTGTRFVMVRFGNVLGSNGSVIPKFREQIAKGGPVTVTHPEITRYFMSIPEASQLVLQAGLMGQGGEIFVLDMGEPVKIVDLAKELIRLSGYAEDDIRIEFSGLRPGEKLYEELLADNEHTLPTPHPKLRIAKAREVLPEQIDALHQWLDNPPQCDAAVKTALRQWVPEYIADTRDS